jgi:large subunit ribosomal protein L15
MVLHRRIPKRGFRSHRAQEFAIVNLVQLNRFEPNEFVNPERLAQAGLIKPGLRVKILGQGELEVSLRVQAHRFSSSAQKGIEEGGGSWEVIP